MKAIVIREFGGPEVMRMEDFPDPVAGPGEVVVKVHAVSVNRTLDLVVRAGKYAKPVKLPHILGVDPSGVIAQVGPGVTDRKPGDRVITAAWRTAPSGPMDSLGVQHLGGYAEYVKLPASATLLIPDSVDFPTATIIGRHAPAAYTLVNAAELKKDEWVLVMGASGGLGAAAVQIAKYRGAKVIAAAGADERVQAALELGADEGINYRSHDLTEEVLRITGKQGVNVVFENVGDPVLFPKALMSLARQGRLVTSGAHAGGQAQIDLHRVYLYQLSILGRLGAKPADADIALRAAAEGRYRVLIDRIMPLSQAAEAHRRVAERSGIGKVILDPTRLA
jgi:NADPH2:quinone reductase